MLRVGAERDVRLGLENTGHLVQPVRHHGRDVLVLTQYNHIELSDIPDPEVGAEDVLVRVHACGICGSDIHGYDGSGVDRIQIDGYTAAETQIIDTPDGLITTFAFTDGSWLEVHSTSPLGGSWDFV